MTNNLVNTLYEESQDNPDSLLWQAAQKLEQAEARVAELEHLIRYAQVESGVCMCGDEIDGHNQASGHSPVDIWDHASEKALEGTSDAWLLRKKAEAVESLRFPVMMRKMWSGGEVDSWLNSQARRLRQQADEAENE